MMVRVADAARRLGLHPITVRRLFDNGKIKGVLIGKQRFFPSEELDRFEASFSSKVGKAVIYGRVSTKKQDDSGNLKRQIERLENHVKSIGMEYISYSDVASGLNENRRGLNKMLKDIARGDVTHVFIEHRDRLARFGFKYLESHIQTLGATIVVMDETTEKTPQEELVDDMISIVTSFSARIYGARGGAIVKKMKEAINDSS